MYSQKIGIIGGFGAYATIDFFERILKTFERIGGSERDYPHLIMDNNFTMPSRTRALLYGDDYDVVTGMIAESLKRLCVLGVDYIIMVCGTAHGFLNDAIKLCPEAEGKVINIIECLKSDLETAGVEKVLVLAAEGTLDRRIYNEYLGNIECISLSKNEYNKIRMFIEAIKQNCFDDEIKSDFRTFIRQYGVENVILGCTEFPVLIKKCLEDDESFFQEFRFWDPLEATLNELKRVLI